MNTKLCIVIPCFNEEEVLGETADRLKEKISQLIKSEQISGDSRILFVDDGSSDATWNIICELHNNDNTFGGLKLSKNCGHQKALLAGLTKAADYADAVISMDADLQDDIHAIDGFLEKYQQGFDVVYGVRSRREKDSFFKRRSAEGFYKLMGKMGVDIVYNHADYRLLSHRAVCALLEFKEVNLFLRGLVPLVGYSHDYVYYERNERFAGESKYPVKKMISFAFEGVTSFSIKPIRFIFSMGIGISVITCLAIIYALISYLLGHTVGGWTSLIMSIWLLGGLQLIAIGLVGEYIGKIYLETKRRPHFFIEEDQSGF